MAAKMRSGLILAAAIVCGAPSVRAELWASSAAASTSWLVVTPINPATGAYGATATISGGTGSGAEDLAGDPFWQGGTLWGVRRRIATSYLASWNPVAKTILSEVVINTPSLMRTLAIDPTNGRFYGTTDTNLYSLDPLTGNATLVGPTGMTVEKSLAFDGSGQLYGVGMENKLVAIDKTSGAASQVATMALYRIEGMAWHRETGTMLGLGYGYGTVSYALFEIHLADGALTHLGPSLGRPSTLAITGLAADFDGDGTVTSTDYEIWRTHAAIGSGGDHAHGDANGDGAINGADYLAWQRQLGSTIVPPGAGAAVPEPCCALLAAVALAMTGRLGAPRSSTSTLGHVR